MPQGEPSVAIFRPDDGRLAAAARFLSERGVSPVTDPMLAVDPAGTSPRPDADYTILTSKTGVELAAEHGWTASETTVCAIGETTASALRDAGYPADIVPETYSSRGLVEALAERVDGARVEVARSDHGSQLLLDGLEDAGAYVHETVLYRLTRPAGAGTSTERAASGTLDAALFTSSLTVERFLAAAEERGVRRAAVDGLEEAVVGAIGDPTRETAEREGVTVDVVPAEAEFETLAREVVDRLEG